MIINRNGYVTSKNLPLRGRINKPAIRSAIAKETGFVLRTASGYFIKLNILSALMPLLYNITRDNEDRISSNSGWETNTRVIAPVGQNILSYSAPEDSFSKKLLDLVGDKKANTIEQATSYLSQNGYHFKPSWNPIEIFTLVSSIAVRNKTFYPLQSPDSQLGIFNREDKGKDRFVLVFNAPGEERFKTMSEDLATKMKEIYDIPDSNVVPLEISGPDDLKKGVEKMAEKINSLNDKSNAELLVFYHGHGDSESLKNGDERIEGAMEGVLGLPQKVKESYVKELFKEKFQGIKTLFVADTCHSGAWIAQTPQKAAQAFSRLV